MKRAHRRGRCWRANRRGAVLVEFVIVLPVFLLIMVTILELARAFNIWQVVVNSARVGARIVALPPGSQSNATVYDAAISNYLTSNALDVDTQCTWTGWAETGGEGPPGSPGEVTVECQYTFAYLGGVMALVGATGPDAPVTLESTSTMRNE